MSSNQQSNQQSPSKGTVKELNTNSAPTVKKSQSTKPKRQRGRPKGSTAKPNPADAKLADELSESFLALPPSQRLTFIQHVKDKDPQKCRTLKAKFLKDYDGKTYDYQPVAGGRDGARFEVGIETNSRKEERVVLRKEFDFEARRE